MVVPFDKSQCEFDEEIGIFLYPMIILYGSSYYILIIVLSPMEI